MIYLNKCNTLFIYIWNDLNMKRIQNNHFLKKNRYTISTSNELLAIRQYHFIYFILNIISVLFLLYHSDLQRITHFLIYYKVFIRL